VLPDGVRAASVAVRDGRIAEVLDHGEAAPPDAEVVELGDLALMPGLVDTHVHVNEPGRTAWEGFETATRAAAAGGVTTLVDMPLNSAPVTTTRQALQAKREAAAGKLRVDCGLYGGVVPGNAAEISALAAEGVLGFKAFLVHSGIDDFPAADARTLREAMPRIAEAGLPLLAHAELPPGGHRPAAPSDPRSYAAWLRSRPPSWEVRAVELLVQLSRETGCRVHVVHVACLDAVRAIHAAQRDGLPITCETCPHYLVFCAEEIPDGDPRFKCAPPIREDIHREALWHGLADGTISMVVSDHSPCPPEMKRLDEGDIDAAWGGIASLQLGLPAVWTAAHLRGFGLEEIARWLAAGPAALVGLADTKGAIARGCDADLVAWSPEAAYTVDPERLFHRHAPTPYAGQELQGRVERTWVRGQLVYDRGAFPGAPVGRLLRGDAA
jgi:allantoinase